MIIKSIYADVVFFSTAKKNPNIEWMSAPVDQTEWPERFIFNDDHFVNRHRFLSTNFVFFFQLI